MSKRFIDTGYYKSPFVRSLKGSLKALYNFIICDCDGSGIWAKDLEIASVLIGFEVTDKDFNQFLEAGKAIDLENGRFFFPDFIEHQYPGGLQEKNPAHKNFISVLLKYNLLDENLKPLERPSKGSKVMVKVIDKVKVEEKVIPTQDEFLEYCKTFLNGTYVEYEFSLKAKYDQWKDAGWIDGRGKKIKIWKTAIKNTVPYLKKFNTNGNKTATDIKANPQNGYGSL